jgi:hypothetical protein
LQPSDFSVHNPTFFSNPKLEATRHLTPKSQILIRFSAEKDSAVPVSIHQSDLPALKINAELTCKRHLSAIPSHHVKPGICITGSFPGAPQGYLLRQNHRNHASTQPFEMVPEFPFLIPGIVFLTAAPIFPAVIDSDFLKILDEIPLVIPKECFHRAGFSEMKDVP